MSARVPGWPGLVGIAVLVGGLFVLLGRPAISPLGGAASGAGGYLQTFLYASLDGPPNEPLDVTGAGRRYAEVDAAITALGEEAHAQHRRHVIALFRTPAEAEATRENLDDQPTQRAFALDRLLLVIGLPTDEDGGPTPLADELRDDAELVLVEGDRYGEGTIALDLSCTASDEAAATEIATALGDYGAVPYYAHLRPPWVGEPLTDDEALARSTYRRWVSAMQTAFGTEPWIGSWSQRYVAARTSEERGALQAELAEHLADVDPASDGEFHAGVAALLESRQTAFETDPDAYVEWGIALGSMAGMLSTDAPDGVPTWFDERRSAQLGAVRSTGSRVEIGFATFGPFVVGGLGLLSYLEEHDCTDVLVTLSDWDDVRGD